MNALRSYYAPKPRVYGGGKKGKRTAYSVMMDLPSVPRDVPDPISAADMITADYNFRPSTWASQLPTPPSFTPAEQAALGAPLPPGVLSSSEARFEQMYRDAEKRILWPVWLKQEERAAKTRYGKTQYENFVRRIANMRGMTVSAYKKYLTELASEAVNGYDMPPDTFDELLHRMEALDIHGDVPPASSSSYLRDATLARKVQRAPVPILDSSLDFLSH